MKKVKKPHEPTASLDDFERLYGDGEVTITTASTPATEASTRKGATATAEIAAADHMSFPPAKAPTPETDPDLFDFAGNRL